MFYILSVLLEGRKSTRIILLKFGNIPPTEKCKYISKGVIIKSLLASISCTNITFCYLFLYPFQNNQKLNARLQRSHILVLCRIQNQVCSCRTVFYMTFVQHSHFNQCYINVRVFYWDIFKHSSFYQKNV